jgi:hypothetical protein
MDYTPDIKSAQPKQKFQVGKHMAVLLGDIESDSRIRYLHILVVFDQNQQPGFFVTAEVNVMARRFGGGSHFLGVFDGRGHLNMGASDDWADEAKFTAEALRIANEKLGTTSQGVQP